MKKIFIDEYLTEKIRNKINELVNLNLDANAVMSLLSNELFGYADYMRTEVKRYVMYMIWLHDKNKDTSDAFLKYKKRTNQMAPDQTDFDLNGQKVHLNRNHDNELVIAQKRKEEARIQELSKLIYKEFEQEHHQEPIIKPIDTNKILDQVIESMSDDELQQTLTSMLDKDPTINKDLGDIMSEYEKDDTLVSFTLPFEEKQKLFEADSNDELTHLEFNQTLNEIEEHDPTLTTVLLGPDTTNDITFEDIVETQTNLLDPTYSINPEIFDATLEEDNGTQNLDDVEFLNDDFDFVNYDEDSTQQALEFLENMEAKYGNETIITINEKAFGLNSANEPVEINQELKIGDNLHYKNQDCVITNIKEEKDFFGNLQTIIYLKDENDQEIKLNSKKIK
ncbi:hypothetical protein [Williamsoniiplasma lucivorax]|uniref:Uncharacterized protein n=1 Tax=Williamsoniiplasma lucivorax TaxID=209274 RepID=A0A2S5RDH7_9MOLU|nr:hypothetical protein [Williamsoniiplasma lucivorax]PPE05175.1 hypothetical protein ELUCI_v1c07110 [Williamsoniiplasma lucivorax]